jgi:hypothetical protein
MMVQGVSEFENAASNTRLTPRFCLVTILGERSARIEQLLP